MRALMKDATDDEVAEAARVWFSYLQILDAMVTDMERAERDSRTLDPYVTLPDDVKPDV